jgi:hypothetical protein
MRGTRYTTAVMSILRLLAVSAVLLLVLGQAAMAITDATVRPFDYPPESTYEFAILGQDNVRIATAYYRILLEESQGRKLYRFKYMARNEAVSESTECWIDPVTMIPVRSVRKLVTSQGTSYQDIAYSQGVIIVRRKQNDGPVRQSDIVAPPKACYDYETLFWLIPQLDFTVDSQLMLSMFSMVNEQVAFSYASDLGARQITIGSRTYDANAYNIRYGLAPYMLYTVMQSGYAVPARIEMGKNTFVNIKLDPAKVKLPRADAAKPPAEAKATPPKPETGKAKAKPKAKDQEQPPDPGANPLGPPPPGGQY